MAMQKYSDHIKRITRPFSKAIDLLLPPRCIGTGEIVSNQGMISPDLWSELNFISAPFCNICGRPFELADELTDDAICAACIETPPRYDYARAALTYNDASRKLLLRFKYGDQQHAALTFATWLKNCVPIDVDNVDYITPVPLHWRRHWQRRFNQSALIATSLSSLTKIPVLHALKRKRFTTTQKGLKKRERQKNVRMAFAMHEKHIDKVTGKNIILVDDVMTSGATINECAKILKRYGAQSVCVLTVTRVMREPEFYPEIDEFNVLDEGY